MFLRIWGHKPGLARIGHINFKHFLLDFGIILGRDVFHWIRVAEMSNLPVCLRLWRPRRPISRPNPYFGTSPRKKKWQARPAKWKKADTWKKIKMNDKLWELLSNPSGSVLMIPATIWGTCSPSRLPITMFFELSKWQCVFFSDNVFFYIPSIKTNFHCKNCVRMHMPNLLNSWTPITAGPENPLLFVPTPVCVRFRTHLWRQSAGLIGCSILLNKFSLIHTDFAMKCL